MAAFIPSRCLKVKHPCPDCGAELELPVNAISRPEGRDTVVVSFELDESFIDLVSQHALAAPVLHPSFVTADTSTP